MPCTISGKTLRRMRSFATGSSSAMLIFARYVYSYEVVPVPGSDIARRFLSSRVTSWSPTATTRPTVSGKAVAASTMTSTRVISTTSLIAHKPGSRPSLTIPSTNASAMTGLVSPVTFCSTARVASSGSPSSGWMSGRSFFQASWIRYVYCIEHSVELQN